MSSNPREQSLQALFDEVVDELRKKIKDGSARPQDLAVAAKLLKDNGIESVPLPGKNRLGDLLDDVRDLPFPKGELPA
jgi:hypothetical protein